MGGTIQSRVVAGWYAVRLLGGGGREVVKYCIMKNKYLLRLQGEVNITVILWNTSHSESTECVDLLHTENVLLTPLTSLTLKCS